jgi:carboxymethylenebutenolidase
MPFYRGMTCENVTINGDKGTPITAYVARPSGSGPFPGVVLVHHLPGWSEFYIETTRRFAHHGYLAICANLYEREGGGSDANPDDVGAKVRAEGGIADSQMVGDTEAAVKWMRAQPGHNGKVGLIGSCSGGRHAFIYACQRKDVDACVEQWGGRVVMGKEELNPKTPVAPIDMTKDLSCPLLGLFGNDDRAPSPEQVNQHEAELKKHCKTYDFHRYDGAGHGFFYWHRPLYRPEQAMDGWSKIEAQIPFLGWVVASSFSDSVFRRREEEAADVDREIPPQSRDRCARRPHAPTESKVARSPRAPSHARRDRRSRPEAAQ